MNQATGYNQATGTKYATSIFGACLKPRKIGRVATGRASGLKMGDKEGGSLISLDGVAPSRIVGVSASDISPCTIKSRTRFSGTSSPG